MTYIENRRAIYNRFKLKRRTLYYDLLGGVCIDCGTNQGLTFDHVNPLDKEFEIGEKLFNKIEDILPELQKCQLLCRHCHGKKTALDNGFDASKHGNYTMYSKMHCRCSQCKDYGYKNNYKYVRNSRIRKQLRPIFVYLILNKASI